MPETKQIRGHSITLLEPNLLLVRLCGDVSADDVREIHQARLRMSTPGPLFHVLDLSQFGSMGPDARRAAMESAKARPYKGLAVFGANLQTRTMLTLIWTARSLLTSTDSKVFFAKTEAEARAWVDQHRADAT